MNIVDHSDLPDLTDLPELLQSIHSSDQHEIKN